MLSLLGSFGVVEIEETGIIRDNKWKLSFIGLSMLKIYETLLIFILLFMIFNKLRKERQCMSFRELLIQGRK
jgi:hypothetical protein